MPYKEEEIPNTDYLYRRIHKSQIDKINNIPGSGAFTNLGIGMSTDWDKYSSPDETRNRIGKSSNPFDYGVVRLNVGIARKIKEQKVKHTPKNSNRSHSDVIGAKTQRIKKEFKKIAEWIYKPGE